MENIRQEMTEKLTAAFQETFGRSPEGFACAPGRVELLGNHTDHQRGKVLAASVDLKAYAAFALNGTDTVSLVSEGHSSMKVSVKDLMPDVSEFNTAKSILRGMLKGFYDLKAPLSGFDIYIISEVLTGSGLSSSAAFEVLLGRVLNLLFMNNSVSAIEIAKIGWIAENRFFGKPCGLMDQAASSIGNVVFFDFEDPAGPKTEQISFDFQKAGYALCAVACGAGHANLTADYAAIPREMKQVASFFGKDVLREVAEEEFLANKDKIIEALGERPYLRALHFFEESRRAQEAADALRANDISRFLELANESGISSRTQLKNIIPDSDPSENKLDLAMRYAIDLLKGTNGAVRMNGGGFSGTFLSVVPLSSLDAFRDSIEERLGKGAVQILNT
ncbi:MAG: galactokinase [Parasporobacterium sp.]|nr:galactokinase [Parasporobacterium sp.]